MLVTLCIFKLGWVSRMHCAFIELIPTGHCSSCLIQNFISLLKMRFSSFLTIFWSSCLIVWLVISIIWSTSNQSTTSWSSLGYVIILATIWLISLFDIGDIAFVILFFRVQIGFMSSLSFSYRLWFICSFSSFSPFHTTHILIFLISRQLKFTIFTWSFCDIV